MPLFCPVPQGTPAVPGGNFAAAVDRAVLHRVAEPRPRGARAQSELPRARPQRPDRIVYLTGVGADEALRRADKGTVDYVPYDYDAHGPMSVGGPRDRAFGATSAAARRGDQRFFANDAPGLDMLALNARRPLFRDVAMRRAVSEALDRPALAAVWGEPPTDRYVPPSLLPATGRPRYPLAGPDVAEARRLAAGRRGRATLYYCGESGNQRIAEIVRANLRPIGIRVLITPSLGCLRGHDPAADAADIAPLSPASLALDAARLRASRAGTTPGSAATCSPRAGGTTRRSCAPSRERTRSREASGTRRSPRCRRRRFDVSPVTFSGFVRPEYVVPRVGCRVLQSAYGFLDLAAACVNPATT